MREVGPHLVASEAADGRAHDDALAQWQPVADDGAEILVRRNKGAPVAALAWNAKGTLLAFADEEGDGGLLEL